MHCVLLCRVAAVTAAGDAAAAPACGRCKLRLLLLWMLLPNPGTLVDGNIGYLWVSGDA